jgi:hypothetical protein
MIRRVFASVAVVCLAALVARAEPPAGPVEMVDNPPYLAWKDCAVGTSVSFSMDMSMSALSMTMNSTGTQTLKSVTADEVVLETATSMGGQQQKQETRVPAKVKKGTENIPEGMNGKVTPAGNETIEVAGKKYDCELQDFSGEQQGNSFTGRVWKTMLIPGGVAKMTMEGKSADGQTMTVTMVVTSIDKK